MVGLAVIIAAEAALFLDVRLVGIYFTPLVWTGYILAVDAAVFRLRGRSVIKTEPQAFVWMVVLSIFLWLIFEGYNLYLRNWIYVGLPNSVIPVLPGIWLVFRDHLALCSRNNGAAARDLVSE